MDERQIGLALTLKELGVSSDVSGFNSRLILQKTVYLLEEAGIRLGYSFNWYLRGPYSPGLTRDLYDLNASSEDVADWELDKDSTAVAQRIRGLIEGAPGENPATKARRLELFASVRYLASRNRLNPANPVEATQHLAHNGKHFPEPEVADAIQSLQEAGLL